jgi:hypothetical protein
MLKACRGDKVETFFHPQGWPDFVTSIPAAFSIRLSSKPLIYN